MSAHAVTIDEPADLLVEDRGGVRILAMGRGKANAMSTEFAAALHGAALRAQEDPAVRGVVLTSRSPKIFCGGFDLRLLARAGREDFARFVHTFDALFFDLFLLGKPLIAALTGHAVAGGALLAATADFRFAAEGPGTIGLPGVRLGIHMPRHLLEAARSTVGEQTLTRWALLGETMPFREARELGAIDRIVPRGRLLEEAVNFAEQLGSASSEVYTAIKRDLRGTAYEKARAVLPEGRKAFVASWFSEIGQRGLASALRRGS
ncbi:MAG: enoyl-CoA hydratase/isomerase family protein [Thermoanaerobaculia bacterium]|nr:enoyl-CoA hydratase/isomerase family protein [Thermoanaerobaculia bacterium]